MEDIQTPFEQQYGEDSCENDTRAAEHHGQASADVLQAHALKQDAHHAESPRNDKADNSGPFFLRNLVSRKTASILALPKKYALLHEMLHSLRPAFERCQRHELQQVQRRKKLSLQ